jgi:nucleoside-diphosphate-sugar epimerase
VDDVVSSIVCALKAEAPSRMAYNINGAETVTIGEILDLIARQLPAIRAEIGPGLLPDTDIQGKMSLDAAYRDLGWRPQIPFADGLRSYISWLKDHPY